MIHENIDIHMSRKGPEWLDVVVVEGELEKLGLRKGNILLE